MLRLYEKGVERLDHELSIDYILKVLAQSKTLLKMPINQNKTLLEDMEKNNVIDLDADSEEEDEVEFHDIGQVAFS